MIFIAGVILMIVAVVMAVILVVNSRRPKTEAKVVQIFYQHVKSDKERRFRQQKHAKVTYSIGGHTYESEILHWSKEAVGEQVVLTYHPEDHSKVRLYAPGREMRMVVILFLIGLSIVLLSLFVINTLA